MAKTIRKRRDYDNPVFVNIIKSSGESFRLEVCDYRVADSHLVLVRDMGSCRQIKYVRLDTLTSFSFDQPHNFQSRFAPATSSPVPVMRAPAAVPRPVAPAWTPDGAPGTIGPEAPVVRPPVPRGSPGSPVSEPGDAGMNRIQRARAVRGMPNGGMS